MNTRNPILWSLLLLVAALLALPRPAGAVTIPATSGYSAWENASYGPTGSCASSDGLTALKCHIARLNSTSVGNIGSCSLSVNTATAMSGTCVYTPTGSNLSGGVSRSVVYTCPSGYTLSGTNCTSTPATDAKAVADALNGLREPLFASGTPALSVCYGGFVVTGQGAVQARGSMNFEVYGPFTADGTACTSQASGSIMAPAPAASAAAAGCSGFYGTVNGVERCVPKVPDIGSGSVTSGGTTTSTDASNTVSKSTATTCDGGKCTTTTTTTTTPVGGGSPTTATTSKTESLADFCTANPKATVCAQAVDDECKANPSRVGCLDTSGTITGEPITRATSAFTVTPVTVTGSSGCPAPVSQSFTLAGASRSFSFSYQPACDFAAFIAPFLLLVAAFGAAYIVADSFKVQA